jgi:hypothetical protein
VGLSSLQAPLGAHEHVLKGAAVFVVVGPLLCPVCVLVIITIYIVTCQPFVGLRNRALLGSRQINASRPSTRCAAVGEAGSSPRIRDDVTQQHWNTVPARVRDDVTRQHARFRGNAV